jgi:hypothetical protein
MDIYLPVPAYRGLGEIMSTLLKIDVSPRGDYSISRKLGNHFATEWQSNHVGGKIVTRDLAKTNIPYVDLPWIAGAFSAPDKHTAEHKASLKISDELIAELLAATRWSSPPPCTTSTFPPCSRPGSITSSGSTRPSPSVPKVSKASPQAKKSPSSIGEPAWYSLPLAILPRHPRLHRDY